ncbi:MAG TPA: GWxTD domain-containing protein [Candidatus Acidoferrales bacterium]|nr:GWxTD domain-containing protein [Candidatus Acidoferrales bacterium]
MRTAKAILLSLLAFGVGYAAPPLHAQDPVSQDQQGKELNKKDQKKREKELMKELGDPYKQWLDEVSYIIMPEERQAFLRLQTNEEREQFIERFWARRNPDPESPENEFKDEYYRRIAYANEHYSSGIPGWKTDRGRIYIMWGPPDNVESHPAGGPYERPPEEGGGETSTYPFEDWEYHYLPGIGENVQIEFVDPTMSGEYHLTMDPSEKDALLYVPGAGLTDLEAMGMANKTDRFSRTDGTHMGTPMGSEPESMNEFSRLELYAKIQQPPPVKFKDLEAVVTSRLIRDQLPFQYRFDFLRITDATDLVPVTVEVPNKEMTFQDKDGVQTATLNIFGRVSTLGGRITQTFEDTVRQQIPDALLQKSLDGRSIYQKAIPLRPGLYRLDLVVKDVNSGNIGVINTRLPVPRYDDTKLASSTLILADDIQGVSARDIGLGQFVLGDVKVRPRLDATFKKNETLGLYLQVYNLKIDPQTHHSSASVDYLITSGEKQILKQTDSSAQLGQNGEQLTLDKQMNLSMLPAGHYKMQITVHDNLAQQEITQSTEFNVKPADKVAVSQGQR